MLESSPRIEDKLGVVVPRFTCGLEQLTSVFYCILAAEVKHHISKNVLRRTLAPAHVRYSVRRTRAAAL